MSTQRPRGISLAPDVAYELPIPNAGLPLRGRLQDYHVQQPGKKSSRFACAVEGEPLENYMSPMLCERAMRRDPLMQKIADELIARGPIKHGGRLEAEAVRRLRKRFIKAVAPAILEDVYTRMEKVADDLVKYYLAFRAVEVTRPGRFQSPDEEEKP